MCWTIPAAPVPLPFPRMESAADVLFPDQDQQKNVARVQRFAAAQPKFVHRTQKLIKYTF